MAKKLDYDEASIEVLGPRDAVRKNLGLYIGGNDSFALYQATKEIIDNSADEANAGRNDLVGVIIEGSVITVYDRGRGIPVGANKQTGRSTLIEVFATLHAGGKSKTSDAYKTGSIGCFVGSTKIKLLNGKSVPIARLYSKWQKAKSKFWVYAFDLHGSTAFTPRECYNVQLSKYVTKTAIVKLDNGKSIECTVDHPFLTYDGYYVPANQLTPGQSLRVLHTALDKDGYETHSGRKRFFASASHMARTNRTVMKALGKNIVGKEVHHKNANKSDNRPKNLKPMSNQEHFWADYYAHGKHDAWVNKSNALKEVSSKNAIRLNLNKENGYDAQQGKIVQCAARALRDFGKLTRKTYAASRGWCYPNADKAEFYLDSWNNLKIAAQNYLDTYGENGRVENSGQGLNYKLLSEYESSPADNINNHQVVSVTYKIYKKAIPVYGISVEVDHNYLLDAGVFVKNTHGVGAAVTNYISKSMTAYTYREEKGGWHKITFTNGVPSKDIVKCKAPIILGKPAKLGTVVVFEPDMSIFAKGASLRSSQVGEYLRILSYLSPKVKFELTVDGKTKEYYTKEGLKDYLAAIMEKEKIEAQGKPIIFNDAGLSFALQWTNYSDELVLSYVNGSYTKDGGTHLKGLQEALMNAIKPYKGKYDFTPSDMRNGLVGVINVKVASPSFDSQVKGRLVTASAYNTVYDTAFEQFSKMFKSNKSFVSGILKRAAEMKKLRASFQASKKAIADLRSDKGKRNLTAKLMECQSRDTKINELFIVEGDSAKGSCKLARDDNFQAVLALRGKIVNAYGASAAKVFSNNEVQDILRCIGYTGSDKKDIKFRYGKIILLTDPDDDGWHISLLLLNLLHKVVPEALEQNLVYAVDAPLFMYSTKNGKFYADTVELLKAKVKGKFDPQHVTRLKGWGEANPPEMVDLAFSSKTRKLIKIDKLGADEAVDHFNIVGKESVQGRRQLLGI